jgi:hypothetical protein
MTQTGGNASNGRTAARCLPLVYHVFIIGKAVRAGIQPSAETFTVLNTISRSRAICNGYAFSPDDQYMAVACAGYGSPPPDPAVSVYKITGSYYFTKLAFPIPAPRRAYSVSFSPDGAHLACGLNRQYMDDPNDSVLVIFKRTGDSFSRLSLPNWFGTSDRITRALIYTGASLLLHPRTHQH